MRPAPELYAPYAAYDKAAYFNNIHPVEWRAQLQSSTGGRLFRIRYYGDLYRWEVKQEPRHIEHHEKHYGKHFNGLITNSDDAPELIYAVDIHSGEEILLFDGGRQGHDNLFCNEWTPAQLNNRPLTHDYTDAAGNSVFEIVLHAFFNIDYEDELETFQDEAGEIRFITGEKTDLAYLQRNGFDAFAIDAYSEQGDFIAIHSAELA
ncbi:hypothetical protein [Chitinophaga qingshengii]|uniref:Uncharacterized protein n=1 Tax=Chitinophaga qingshengii TaxID=1569794 RepID=A0ABR7TQF4_9BACT|nr:hypothetical protein [Chitinophaga qingshengii]MBC9931797.1 hypothetical protein [Chitinophaga qingshengii]